MFIESTTKGIYIHLIFSTGVSRKIYRWTSVREKFTRDLPDNFFLVRA